MGTSSACKLIGKLGHMTYGKTRDDDGNKNVDKQKVS